MHLSLASSFFGILCLLLWGLLLFAPAWCRAFDACATRARSTRSLRAFVYLHAQKHYNRIFPSAPASEQGSSKAKSRATSRTKFHSAIGSLLSLGARAFVRSSARVNHICWFVCLSVCLSVWLRFLSVRVCLSQWRISVR